MMTEVEHKAETAQPEAAVFVIDDEQLVLNTVAAMLDSHGIRCETFLSGSRFLEQFDPERPGCVLIDLRLSDMDGIELQRRIQSRDGSLPTIMFSGRGTVSDVAAAMRGGAIDFLQKPVERDILVGRIKEALRVDQETRAKHKYFIELRDRMMTFSPRERQVAGYVVDGMTAKEIAARLGIETKTVEVHRSRLVRKAASGSTLEFVRDLAAYGIRESDAFFELIPARK